MGTKIETVNESSYEPVSVVHLVHFGCDSCFGALAVKSVVSGSTFSVNKEVSKNSGTSPVEVHVHF